MKKKNTNWSIYKKLTGFITSIDAVDCELTKAPPIRLGTLWYFKHKQKHKHHPNHSIWTKHQNSYSESLNSSKTRTLRLDRLLPEPPWRNESSGQRRSSLEKHWDFSLRITQTYKHYAVQITKIYDQKMVLGFTYLLELRAATFSSFFSLVWSGSVFHLEFL